MRFKGSSLLVGVIGFASFRRRRPPGLRENGVLGEGGVYLSLWDIKEFFPSL